MGGMTRFGRTARGAISLVALTLLVPSGTGAQSLPPMPSPVLSVEGAWARTSPMIELAGAVFMTIRNGGPTDDALVAATSPAAAIVEIHETTERASGEMTMALVTAVPVPSGGMAELKPGGYHVMLIDLVEPLDAGMTLELELTFASGATLHVSATVADGPPSPDPSMALARVPRPDPTSPPSVSP
jgi:copper(I)-binding protein